MQTFDTLDLLRLEVQAEWPDLPNLVLNPSGEFGAFDWQVFEDPSLPGYIFTTLTGPPRFRLGVDPSLAPFSSDNTVETVPLPIPAVVAGSAREARGWVTVTGHQPLGGDTAAFQLWAYDAAGIGSLLADIPLPVATTGTFAIPPTALPVGTVAVGARLGIHELSDLPVWRDYNDVAIVAGTPTEVAAADPPTVTWVDVTGPTTVVGTERDELNVGLLTATIYDSALDPAQVDLIRPGKRVRLQVLVDGVWENLFTGLLDNPSAAYLLRDPDLPDVKRTKVDIVASDATAALAAANRPEGVATIADLPYVLAGTGVPWNINGSDDAIDPTSVIVVARNEQASALDQVAITRDSVLGTAWVDRNGALRAYDTAALPSTPTGLLDETTYTDIVIDYDVERLINAVMVRLVRINPGTNETEEVTWGPYEDPASIREWRRRTAEFRVQGIDEADIPAFADAVLAANATPTKRINEIRLTLATEAAVEAHALRDLLDLVSLSNDRGGIVAENARITSVKHNITPERWTLALGFTSDGTVAPPQVTPSPIPGGGKTLAQLLRPVGEVTTFYCAKTDIPQGWLALDGSTFDAALYPALAALLGGNVLPDFTDRFPIGAGTKALGTSGGAPTAQLTAWQQLPPHSHGAGTLQAASSGSTHAHAHGSTSSTTGNSTANVARGTTSNSGDANFGTGSSGAHSHNVTGNTAEAGQSAPFDVMNPWRALWFAIRAT